MSAGKVKLMYIDRKLFFAAIKRTLPEEILDKLCTMAITNQLVTIQELRKMHVRVDFSYFQYAECQTYFD